MWNLSCAWIALSAIIAAPATLFAQAAPTPPEDLVPVSPLDADVVVLPGEVEADESAFSYRPFGMVELHFTWALQNPEVGILALRGWGRSRW